MQNAELDGLKKLRGGAFFIIISPLLETIAFILFLPSLIGGVFAGGAAGTASGGAAGGVAGALGAAIGVTIIFIAMIVIGAVLGILGVLRLRSGFSILQSLGRDVGIGSTGGTLYLVGLILTLIGAILTLAIIGIFILVIAAILTLIGEILLGVGLYKVGDVYNEGLTKIGGILAAIPMGLISFVGYILVYIGLGKIINMVSSGVSPMAPYGYPQQPQYQPTYQQTQYPQPTYQQPQFYQVGQGVIKSDGYAKVYLYTTTSGVIVSAVMQNPQLTSSYINPITINPGNNEITIYFGNVSQLQIGNQYVITITINAGGNMIPVNATVVYQG
ncbi:DUF973 family protein [Sulfurisphaera javensis]|uniref:DUF973 family protein n=1 Tax=Sulfurisphaera javensis TaxID=2049879 RepID=A0AAT9GUM8_9CREN